MYTSPYYIPPHTVTRFKERVTDIDKSLILKEIQGQLQIGKREIMGFARWDKQVNPVFLGNYHGKKYIILTQMENDKTIKNPWPVVPTILLMKQIDSIHWEHENGEKKWFAMLWGDQSLTTAQIGVIVGVSQATVCRMAERYGLEGRRKKKNSPWGKQELRVIEKGILKGSDSGEIVRLVQKINNGRPSSSIRVRIHRSRSVSPEQLEEGARYRIAKLDGRKQYAVNGLFIYKGRERGQSADHLLFHSADGWPFSIPFNPAVLREYQIVRMKEGGCDEHDTDEADLRRNSTVGLSSTRADGKGDSVSRAPV